MTGIAVACEWCGAEVTDGSPCPLSFACPDCQRQPGQWCERPSGHRAMQLHAGRVRLAEATQPTAEPLTLFDEGSSST